MKNLRNRNAPPPEIPIQSHLSTAWDKVIAVYERLAEIELLADAIAAGDIDNLLTPEDIDTIAELNAILTDATLGDFASQAEAEGGINNNKTMTPLRVAQAIATFAPSLQNDYAANGPPDGNDDSSQGWSAGSVWIDVTSIPNEAYRCSDPTLGSAVWLKTTLTTDELAQVALTGNSDSLVEGVTKLLLTAAERAKLAGIEAGAEVTSTAKVAAAGAVMDTDFPAEGLMRATTGGGAYTAIKTNLNATVDPTVNNDSTQSYVIYSPWVNTTAFPRKLFICLDASVGAAVWKEVDSGGGGGGGLTASIKTANYTILANEDVGVASTGGVFTVTLKATPSAGDVAFIHDVAFYCGTNAVAIARNGSTINGLAEDASLNTDGGGFWFIYDGTTWLFTPITSGGLSQAEVDARVVAVAGVGVQNEYFDVSKYHIVPQTCSAVTLQAAGGTNEETAYYYLAFDGTAVEYAACYWKAPKRWNLGALRFRFVWKDASAAASKSVRWTLAVKYDSDGDDFGSNMVTYAGVTDTTAASDAKPILISPWVSTGALGGSPAVGDLVTILLYRDPTHAADDLNGVDARLLGVEMEWTANAATDA